MLHITAADHNFMTYFRVYLHVRHPINDAWFYENKSDAEVWYGMVWDNLLM